MGHISGRIALVKGPLDIFTVETTVDALPPANRSVVEALKFVAVVVSTA